MAWFVLHPPAGVRVVSFFITARFASQSDRTAFLEVVLEQLAEVAGQPMPEFLIESTQQAWFGQLLSDAAAACAEDDKRLVLLVDGLDEDRGVTGGPHAHSIAALLPAVPPAGVRVILAGRPDPPVPTDVPRRHPLRDTKIVRRLDASRLAHMVRDDALQELNELLDGQGLGHHLLGLVTVARGGLSANDMAELSGESPWTVEQTLRSVLGRTFHGRLAHWASSSPPVFVLAHEELQQSAAEYLSRAELDMFTSELHEWASTYQVRNWPPETPVYLLRGYHRLLVAAGDVKRMTALTADLARLDRMLDVSGGDSAALAEIATIQEFICGQEHPDLAAMLTLVVTHNRLARRNSAIPAAVPVAWAQLGNTARAETLAHSVTEPYNQVEVLTAIARALTVAGNVDQAREFTDQAETAAGSVILLRESALEVVAETQAAAGDLSRGEATARSIAYASHRAQALAAVAEVHAESGNGEQARRLAEEAETAARAVDEPEAQGRALAAVVAVRAGLGEFGLAEAIARSITDFAVQAEALTTVAAVQAAADDLSSAQGTIRLIGDPVAQAEALATLAEVLAAKAHETQARLVSQQAEVVVRSVTGIPHTQGKARAALVRAQVAAGELSQAEATAQSIPDPYDPNETLAVVARAQAAAGELSRAEAICRSMTDPDAQAKVLAAVAEAQVKAGNLGGAEATARTVTDPRRQANALAAVAGALAAAGDDTQARRVLEHAETAARSVTDPLADVRTMVAVAGAFAAAGELGHARKVSERAESVAQSIADPHNRGTALALAVDAHVSAGDLVRAEAVARSTTDAYERAYMLTAVVKAQAAAEELGQAQATAQSITDPLVQSDALAEIARAQATAGQASQARATTCLITDPRRRAELMAAVVHALVAAGDHAQARQFSQEAETAARSMTELGLQDDVLTKVAKAQVAVGESGRALTTARSITDGYHRAQALAAVAEVLATGGNNEQARQCSQEAETAARSLSDPNGQGQALIAVTRAQAAVGEPGRAQETIRSITNAFHRAQALAAVAAVLAAGGDKIEARQVSQLAETAARSVTDSVLREMALGAVAEAQLKAGNIDQAAVTADSIMTPTLLAGTLVSFTAILAGPDGTPDRANASAENWFRRLLASALARTNAYLILLPVLAKAEPAAVIEAAPALLSGDTRAVRA